jgi:uncharacterized protein YcbX
MTTDTAAGTVTGIWRFPVKSMRGERLQQADLTERGFLGDRAFALLDKETGRIVSAKSVRRFPDMLACQAVFVEPPRPGHELPAVRITLFDGTTFTSDAGNADRLLSASFKREVSLVRAAPADFTSTTLTWRMATRPATVTRWCRRSSVPPCSRNWGRRRQFRKARCSMSSRSRSSPPPRWRR